MADYAGGVRPSDKGWTGSTGQFLSTYNDNRKDAAEAELAKTLMGRAMLEIARCARNWSGPPAELHAAATGLIGKQAASGRWPKTTREFSLELRRIIPQLALHGLTVDFGRNGSERRVTIKTR